MQRTSTSGDGMRITTIRWPYLAFCFACLFSFAPPASSDGFPDTSGAYLPASAPVAIPRPTVDHPALLLEDGRLLVAGGAAISNAYASHPVSLDSEVWDAETGQWQALGNDLRFEGNQRLHLNQLPDGRVLFFASREGQNVKPEYQARLWNPATNAVERLPVAIKSAAGTDIAVLNDGQVLIVNGLEGSADFWNSGTNTLTHTEVPLLENLRWRALPLANGQVLLVETVPDVPVEGKKTAEHSTTVRWDADEDDEWKRIGDLPVPLKQSSLLDETDDGSVRATVDGFVYLLPEEATDWSEAGKAAQSVNEAVANAPTGVTTSLSAPSYGTTESERSWWDKCVGVLDALTWSVIPLSMPILLFVVLKHFDNLQFIELQRRQEKFLGFIAAAFALGIIVLFVHEVLDLYATETIGRHVRECMKEEAPESKTQPTLQRAQHWVSCIGDKNGFIEGVYFGPAKRWVSSPHALPCQYIGRWASSHLGSDKYVVMFTDDGRFTAVPVSVSDRNGPISGAWGVVDDSMVWLYDTGMTWPMDVKRINIEDRSHFSLSGVTGLRTNFELVDAIKSNTCSM